MRWEVLKDGNKAEEFREETDRMFGEEEWQEEEEEGNSTEFDKIERVVVGAAKEKYVGKLGTPG